MASTTGVPWRVRTIRAPSVCSCRRAHTDGREVARAFRLCCHGMGGMGRGGVMKIKGSCHCGATAFEVSAVPENVTQCTCSFCSKRGALWAYYTPSQFRLATPAANLSTYRWGSKTIKHHFCGTCGCGTFTET